MGLMGRRHGSSEMAEGFGYIYVGAGNDMNPVYRRRMTGMKTETITNSLILSDSLCICEKHENTG